MAGIPLGLHRALLPWAQAGVRYLLCDTSADVAALRESVRKGTPGGGSTGETRVPSVSASAPYAERSRWPSPQNAGTDAATPPVRPKTPLAPSPACPARSQSAAPLRGDVEERDARGGAFPAGEGKQSLRAFEQWPESWRALFARTPKNPLLVWSYPELAADLCGRGDKTRGETLRRLFAELALPRGSHAFWPFAPFSDATEEEARFDPEFFFSGIRALRAETVLLLCETPPKALAFPGQGSLQPVIISGVRYVLLYSVGRLADELEHAAERRSRLVSFLKQLSR